MTVVAQVLVGAAVLTGAVLSLLAAIGLHRFPDVFSRMHAATKPATLGLVLVLGAAAATARDPGDVAKLLLVIALQFLTAPVGAHMVGRAAYRSGDDVGPTTALDELAQAGSSRRAPAPDREVPPGPGGE